MLESFVLALGCVFPVRRSIHQHGEFAALNRAQHIGAQNYAVAHSHWEVSLNNKMGCVVAEILRKYGNGSCENRNQSPHFHHCRAYNPANLGVFDWHIERCSARSWGSRHSGRKRIGSLKAFDIDDQ
jgi:hypothetical protein